MLSNGDMIAPTDNDATEALMRNAQDLAQIDHVVLILDWSGSMQGLKNKIIQAVDAQVTALANRSKAMGREVRVSIYGFGDYVECLVFDTDVLRLPSIASLYQIQGMTALADAVNKGLDDLATTSTLYGDHAFLLIAMTDGRENASSHSSLARLPQRLQNLPENWTAGLLVPSEMARFDAEALGFAKGNVGVWSNDAAEFNRTVTAGVEAFTSSRLSGQRSTRSLFSTGPEAVNTATVQAALTALPMDKFSLIPVVPQGAQKGDKVRVDSFIRDHCGMDFRLGTVYYEWSKTETVQPQKRLAVVQKSTGKVFVGTGDEVRAMIGLPSLSTRTAPKANPDYKIFVQSTAPNRNLIVHTSVLVMH
jgi:hypothetical protein